jgi:hypothetical protein
MKSLPIIVLLVQITLSEAVYGNFQNQLNILEAEFVIVHYPARLENAAQQITRMYPSIKSELEQTLRLPVDFKPDIVLMNDRRRFRETTGNDLVVAVALPQRNLMVVDYTRMADSPFMLQTTVKHELCHLVLHRHIDSDNLPRWFDEGVSQWVTGGISELITDPGWSVLENAAMRDNLFRFDELTSFPHGRSETMLAYQQSKSFIEYIIDIYGTAALIDILHEMTQGSSVDRAFATILPHTLREIEYNWSRDIQARVSWFTYLSRNMFQIIFLLAAVLVIIAFIKKLIQRKMERYDDEDIEQLPPDER